MTTEELFAYVQDATDDRIFMIAELFRRGAEVEKSQILRK